MPGPKLSRASVINAVSAVREAGLVPRSISVLPDGTLKFEELSSDLSELVESVLPVEEEGSPLKWKRVCEG